MDVIVAEGLNKTFKRGKVQALKDFSVRIRRGEIFGIIGPNGAGKTTFMNCLVGLLDPDTGRILVEAKPPDSLDVLARIGYVPERLAFDRWMTGRQFLAYHHKLAGRPAEGRDADIRKLLELVELDEKAAGRRIKQYSRGMLQRIAFAQALIGEPAYLYLDEPTSGMDPVGAAAVRGILGELRDRGVTVVLNSHQIEQVERICDRVAFIEAGSVSSVESLAVGSEDVRTMVIAIDRGQGQAPPNEEELAGIAVSAGCEFIGISGGDARFSVAGEERVGQLTKALIGAGYTVTRVASESGRLERLFHSDRGRGDS